MEKEDLLYYFLEKEGLKNPRDYLEVERLKVEVNKKINDENHEYHKISKLYEELEEISKDRKCNLKKFYDITKELDEFIKIDPDLKQDLLFIEEFCDLNDIDKEINFNDFAKLIFGYIKKSGREWHLGIGDISVEENEELDEKKRITFEQFIGRFLGNSYPKFNEFKINLYKKCLEDRRLFDENGNQIESFSLSFIGRMYLVTFFNDEEISIFNEIENDKKEGSVSEFLKEMCELQKDVFVFQTRELYLSHLYVMSNFEDYNKVLETLPNDSLSYFVYSDPESFFDLVNGKEKIKELLKRNFYCVFTELSLLKPEIIESLYGEASAFRMEVKPKSLNEALMLSQSFIKFSMFYEDSFEKLADFVSFLPDSFSELFESNTVFEDFVRVSDAYLNEKKFKFENRFLKNEKSFEELKSKNIIIRLTSDSFGISKDLKRTLDNLNKKVNSVKNIDFKIEKQNLKDTILDFSKMELPNNGLIDDDSIDPSSMA